MPIPSTPPKKAMSGSPVVEEPSSPIRRIFRRHGIQFIIAPVLFVIAFLVLLVIYSRDQSMASALYNATIYTVKFGVVFCLLSIGASIVISASYVDLSTIGLATLSGIIFAITLSFVGTDHLVVSVLLSLFITLIFALGAGTLTAWCVVDLRAPALISTWALGGIFLIFAILATMLAPTNALHTVEGITLPETVPDSFWEFSTGFWLSVFGVFGAYVLINGMGLPSRSCAIGANENSAVYAGVRKRRTLYECFIVNSLLAGAAGIIHIAVLNQASSTDLRAGELIAISIAVLGGTSLSGGYLSIISVISASLFWTCINLISPRLPSIFPWTSSFQSEIGQLIYYIIFLVVVMCFGRLLGPYLPKIYAKRGEIS